MKSSSGADGGRLAPAPWASYDGRNPCGDGFDNRAEDARRRSSPTPTSTRRASRRRFFNPLVAQNRTYTRYEIRVNRTEFDAIAASGWSDGRNLPTPPIPPTFRSARSRQGGVAAADRRRHARGPRPLLRRRRRRGRRRRQERRRRQDRLLEERRRAGRPAHHGQDALPAAMAVEHVRACRQRAAGRRGRGARARRQGRRRALFLFRRGRSPTRSAAARLAGAEPVSLANPPQLDPEPMQVDAQASRSMPRPWR